MAQGPIDYTRGFAAASPLGGAFEAMQAGARFGALEQQRNVLQQAQMAQEQQMQAAQAEQERQRQLAVAVDSLIQNPNATRADFDRLSVLMPEKQREGLINVFNARTKTQQENDLRFAGQVEAALVGGNPEIAQQLITERAAAERNSGREDQARGYETWAQIAQSSPDALRVVVGNILATLPGGGAVLESIGKVRGEARAAQAFEPEQRRRTADAILAELKAKNEPARFGAELGLTEAQTAQARAATAAHAAARQASEATRTAAEAEANRIAEGIIPPAKRPEAEGKLRTDYRNATAGFRDVRDSFQRVLASQGTPQGDIALIFSYMKMLDPGSVVREGEFATAQNAAGIPDRVVNLYNKALSGNGLNEGQRKNIRAQADSLFKKTAEDERRVREGVSRIARNYGLNTDNIFIEAETFIPTVPQPAPAPERRRGFFSAPAEQARGPVAAGAISRAQGQGGAAPTQRNIEVSF
jgi:hypothetical protein